MGFFAFLKKQSQTFRAILFWKQNNPVWTGKDYKRLTEAGYQNCMTVFACVKLIASSVGGVPWSVYQVPKTKRGKLTELPEKHPYRKLILRPNKFEGQSGFFERMVSFLYLSGNSYVERVGPKSGPVHELFCLRPDRMKIIAGDSKEPIRGYEYSVSGQKVPFEFEKILHFRFFHPTDDFYGLSPLEVAARGIDISNMAMEWNKKLLDNDCRPPGALFFERRLQDEQRENLRKELKENYLGYENAAMPLILEGGMDWKQFAFSPKDMDWLNSDKVTTRKICSVFHVPPELIGDSEQKTYSNYKEARKAFYEETVLPLLDYIRDEFNNWLSPLFGDNLRLDYKREEIEALQEEREKVWKRAVEGVKAGVISVNEARVMLGYDEVDGGDVILTPGNLIPLLTIGGKNILEE